MATELPTVDLLGVEILAAGGPIHGQGSPPAGDYWTPEQLRGMAEAAADLGDELKPPAKIGHKGGDPAVGWLENIRVNETGDRLLADIKRVPRGLSSLIDAGAYRTRSVELRSLTSQKTGRKHDWAVSGLAWLGGKMPAVRTLGDVVKLYEADEDPERKFVDIKETEPELDALRDGVADLALELVKVYAEAATARNATPSDSRPVDAKYTDEHRRKFAEATGLEAEKVTDEMLTAAGVPVEEPKVDDTQRDLEAADLRRELSEVKTVAETTRKELEDERKRNFLDGIIKDRKAEPGQRESIEKLYDADPAATIKHFDAVKPSTEAVEYGVDDDGNLIVVSEEETEKRDLAERELIARYYGLELEEVA